MQKLQNMKIRIKNPEHSKQVQECLFKLGFGWGINGKCISESKHPYLYADQQYEANFISFGDTEGYFAEDPNTEVTLEDLQAMLAEPEVPESDSTGTGESPEDDSIPTFSVDNTINTYMSQIQKRLAEVNMVIKIYGDNIHVANMHDNDKAVVDNWDGVLEAIEVKQAYFNLFKGE